MLLVAAVNWQHYMFMVPLTLLSIFLILVILVQRGRGGGLTGALGGMGGQSAFGTKAGDLFTRITIIVAAIWVLLSMASIKVLSTKTATAGMDPTQRGQVAPVDKSSVDKGAGGLLPSATKSAESPAEKTAESAEAPDATATAPASTPPAAEKTDAGAPPADAAKP